jgi:hypothetical protein
MRLFDFELAWARAAFGAVFPESVAMPHGIASLEPERDFADLIAVCPLEQAIGLRLSIWMVALAPLVLLRRARTIAGVSPPEREAVLTLLLASSIYAVRQLTVAFKAMAALLYARAPEIRAAMLDLRAAAVPPPLESGVVVRGGERERESGGTRAA